MTERNMQDELLTHLRERGYRAVDEVACLNRSIDIVFEGDDKALWALELKLRLNKKAIIQGMDAQLSADYSCIVLPRRFWPKFNVSTFFNNLAREGVGLWLWDGKEFFARQNYILAAKRNLHAIKFTEEWLRTSFESRLAGGGK